ncbi:unnamed protein product [Bursaphelenchus okinawaensis]|uniref:Uncharacterized protein n=1 Tax=Bursaphelenchus okinawaensis TaxID=465554 RepID=A0A811KB41_9BILA|nr:unnamed protein product [Bursaphelenchus okinawaensis]CAG9097296.1 unnamed protein product [Bursaphelenchus okinawaensis]
MKFTALLTVFVIVLGVVYGDAHEQRTKQYGYPLENLYESFMTHADSANTNPISNYKPQTLSDTGSNFANGIFGSLNEAGNQIRNDRSIFDYFPGGSSYDLSSFEEPLESLRSARATYNNNYHGKRRQPIRGHAQAHPQRHPQVGGHGINTGSVPKPVSTGTGSSSGTGIVDTLSGAVEVSEMPPIRGHAQAHPQGHAQAHPQRRPQVGGHGINTGPVSVPKPVSTGTGSNSGTGIVDTLSGAAGSVRNARAAHNINYRVNHSRQPIRGHAQAHPQGHAQAHPQRRPQVGSHGINTGSVSGSVPKPVSTGSATGTGTGIVDTLSGAAGSVRNARAVRNNNHHNYQINNGRQPIRGHIQRHPQGHAQAHPQRHPQVGGHDINTGTVPKPVSTGTGSNSGTGIVDTLSGAAGSVRNARAIHNNNQPFNHDRQPIRGHAPAHPQGHPQRHPQVGGHKINTGSVSGTIPKPSAGTGSSSGTGIVDTLSGAAGSVRNARAIHNNNQHYNHGRQPIRGHVQAHPQRHPQVVGHGINTGSVPVPKPVSTGSATGTGTGIVDTLNGAAGSVRNARQA